MTRVGCVLARRRLEAGKNGAWLRRHVAGCAACAAHGEAIGQVEGLLAEVQADTPQPTAELRSRVEFRYSQAVATPPPMADGRRGRFERLVLGAGAMTTALLLVSILWSRKDDFGPPPRQVQIELPAGFGAPAGPSLAIYRASGEVEPR